MARLIRLEAASPIKVDLQDKPAWICACGLTQNLPHCDGSHNVCNSEVAGTLYVYDSSRQAVIEERADESQ